MDSSPTQQPNLKSRITAIVGLFFLSPYIGEFLLGNIPVTMLWLIPYLGILYGLGSILIREYSIRLKLRWNGILILCLVYAIIEEAFFTQSLFDPNYVGLRLLDYGYLETFGIGSWWTVFVLGIHVIWSTAVPISLIDFLSPTTRNKPLLGKMSLAIASLLFIAFCISQILTRAENEFMASKMQFAVSLAIIILLIIIAIFAGRIRKKRKIDNRKIPSPIVIGIISFLLGSIFMAMTFIMEIIPAEANAAGMIVLFALGSILFWSWSNRAAWNIKHALMLTGGLLFTYIWFGFVQVPSIGNISKTLDASGNMLFACIAIFLFYLAWKKVSKTEVSN